MGLAKFCIGDPIPVCDFHDERSLFPMELTFLQLTVIWLFPQCRLFFGLPISEINVLEEDSKSLAELVLYAAPQETPFSAVLF